ncbi:MAG: Na+/H+ antiporter NhaC family protein [Clostridia bacterium]|nr:Na+/H+ antiporter NhaC family protein [Clostridia bacterium]
MSNEKKFFTKKTIAILIAAFVVLGLLIVVTATGWAQKVLTCPTCDGTGVYNGNNCVTCEGGLSHIGSFWALLPAIIAISFALITKEVFSSLFIGILSGGILACNFKPATTIDTVVNIGLIDAVSQTAGIFIFLIELGILVILINRAGGSRAFGEWAETHVKTRIGAILCTFVLGVLIFIDDYFNCLTVGSVMKPVTDKHKISRSKLAYLIDSTAAPICMIAPISSWAAAVAKYVENGQGFKVFIMAIPMNFYSILTLVFVLGITFMKLDFGPMKLHELNALNGDLFSGKQIKQEEVNSSEHGTILDLILPIVFLILFCIFALLYVGGIFNGATMVEAFAETDATIALPWGGLLALIVSIIYFAIRKTISFKDSMESIPKGFIAMVPAILILTFATALKNITGELGADYFVGTLMKNASSTLAKLLPAVIFIVACILAFATGTSWGTFGILIPIVTAMYSPLDPLFILGISACLAGAVCGDHCSPISDTTIMSSAGAECEHINHVSTQIPYAIFVAVVSFVCFIIAGFIPLWYVMLPLSIAIMIGALFGLKFFLKKQEAKKTETQQN